MMAYIRLACFSLFLMFALPASADDRADLAALLTEFLQGAGANDAAQHERFWADDLIYTSSAGSRFGKAEIMSGFKPENETQEEREVVQVYSAEDTTIRVFQNAAVITFKLVGQRKEAGETHTDYYYNTGTFLKRAGQWRAIAWQATKIPQKP